MTVPYNIQDGLGTGKLAQVSRFGELVTGSAEYDQATSVKLDVVNTAYNIIPSRGDSYTVITGIILTANKSVGTNDALVQIYTSSVSGTSREQANLLLSTEIPTRQTLTILPLRILVPVGVWVNAETDDDDIFVTTMHYHINTRRVDQDLSGLSP